MFMSVFVNVIHSCLTERTLNPAKIAVHLHFSSACPLDQGVWILLTVWMKAEKVITYLRGRYSSQHRLGEPFQVLISTILSQRTREENTERASNRLFSKYRTPREIAEAPIEEVEELIRSAGFYRVKARKIQETSSIILKKYGGKVPFAMDELLLLPGVGQKTANCVLAYGFGVSALPVDVHVHRISNRLGLVSTRSPIETEEVLKAIFPEETWSEMSLLMINLGRDLCLPRVPKCSRCGLNKICEYAQRRDRNTTAHFAVDRKSSQN